MDAGVSDLPAPQFCEQADLQSTTGFQAVLQDKNELDGDLEFRFVERRGFRLGLRGEGEQAQGGQEGGNAYQSL